MNLQVVSEIMEIKRFAYAFVGLRPSERQEIARLLSTACEGKAQLRLAASGEHPDFWVINGDEPEVVVRLQDDPAPVVAVAGGVACLARMERPFDPRQAQAVMARLLDVLPDTGSAGTFNRDDPFEMGYAANDAWGRRDGDGDGEREAVDSRSGADTASVASEFLSEYASRMELSPSELAMTEDDPSDLMRLRRAEYEERVSHTLEPTGVSEPITHEWLDVMPAQVLVIADLGGRTHTLPRGLRRMGFGVDVIDGPEHALASLTGKEYRVIFMEQQVTAGETVRVCKALANARNALGHHPSVVVVARRNSTIERWRTLHAGCAEWMQVPLDRRRLLGFLTERGIERSLPRED